MTVSADAKLIPSPPALVDNKNTNFVLPGLSQQQQQQQVLNNE
jgi:hypothetical protein